MRFPARLPSPPVIGPSYAIQESATSTASVAGGADADRDPFPSACDSEADEAFDCPAGDEHADRSVEATTATTDAAIPDLRITDTSSPGTRELHRDRPGSA
jgi:hypothetical protein